jgi:hypothetical protein
MTCIRNLSWVIFMIRFHQISDLPQPLQSFPSGSLRCLELPPRLRILQFCCRAIDWSPSRDPRPASKPLHINHIRILWNVGALREYLETGMVKLSKSEFWRKNVGYTEDIHGHSKAQQDMPWSSCEGAHEHNMSFKRGNLYLNPHPKIHG